MNGNLITRVYNFVDGMKLHDYHLDEELDQLVLWINGKLGDVNIAPDANIQGTKIKPASIPVDRMAEGVFTKVEINNMLADAALGTAPDRSIQRVKIAYGAVGINEIDTTEVASTSMVDALLKTQAQQNVRIWNLEASVLSAREGMAGWQGEGFFKEQDEVQSKTPEMHVVRGVTEDDGYVEAFLVSGFSDTPLRMADPNPSPPSYARDVCWSKDGRYLFAGGGTTTSGQTPVIYIYKLQGVSLTKVGEVTVTPAMTGSGTSVYVMFAYTEASDGDYLIVGTYGRSPDQLYLYKRNAGAGEMVFDLVQTTNAPTGTGTAFAIWYLAWNPTGNHFAVGAYNSGSPYFALYKRTGDTFSQLTNPATMPPNVCYEVAYSPNGQYLAVGHAASPYVTIYKISGDTYTKLANPASLPNGEVSSLAWDSTSTYLVCGTNNTPYVNWYKRAGDVFTKLTNPTNAALSAIVGLDFDPTGTWLVATSSSTAPYIDLYKRSGDTLTKLANPPSTGGTFAVEAMFQPGDGTFLAVGGGTSGLTLYRGNVGDPNTVYGELVLKAKSLSTICNSVYLLDEFSHITGNAVTRKYMVSLDGGTTFEQATIGKLTQLTHTGQNMVVKLVMERPSGDTTSMAYVSWLVAFAMEV